VIERFDVKRVHEFVPDAGGVRRLTRVNPYIRLKGPGDAPPVFLQSGKVWDEGGGPVESPPKWVRDAIRGLTAEARDSVGFSDVHSA
jgi:hypothetical protein